MKNIVIAGAGPIGLYLAIMMSQLIKAYKIDSTITVIDPRLGAQDRPGIVAKMALSLLEENIRIPIGPMKVSDDTDTSLFIQNLEERLLTIAQTLKIHFIHAEFQEFQDAAPKQMVIKTAEGVTTTLVCDFAIDCSGPKRAIVRKIKEHHPGVFEEKKISDNPIKNHFIAYVTMDLKNAGLMAEKPNKDKDPVKYALGLERLRTEFEWPEFIEPELTFENIALQKAPLNFISTMKSQLT